MANKKMYIQLMKLYLLTVIKIKSIFNVINNIYYLIKKQNILILQIIELLVAVFSPNI